jgi:hypothetical protein
VTPTAAGAVESLTMSVSYVCCGHRIRRVLLTGLAASLSFTHCDRCQSTRWYRGDTPVDPSQAPSLPEGPPDRVLRQG